MTKPTPEQIAGARAFAAAQWAPYLPVSKEEWTDLMWESYVVPFGAGIRAAAEVRHAREGEPAQTEAVKPKRRTQLAIMIEVVIVEVCGIYSANTAWHMPLWLGLAIGLPALWLIERSFIMQGWKEP